MHPRMHFHPRVVQGVRYLLPVGADEHKPQARILLLQPLQHIAYEEEILLVVRRARVQQSNLVLLPTHGRPLPKAEIYGVWDNPHMIVEPPVFLRQRLGRYGDAIDRTDRIYEVLTHLSALANVEAVYPIDPHGQSLTIGPVDVDRHDAQLLVVRGERGHIEEVIVEVEYYLAAPFADLMGDPNYVFGKRPP